MADEETKPAVSSDLQKEITGFKKEKLQQTETKESKILPDAATIEAEKKAAKEAPGQ